MNKKIFTLLAGASLLVGSLITVNAQNPYKDKASGTSTDFSDILTADAVKKLPASYDSYFYLLSVTGLANASGSNAATKFTTDLGNSQYVLFVDEQNSTPGNEIMNLRFDDLAKLDSEYDYSYVNPANADYKSSKFGAIRRASWCVEYNTGTVSGSNVIFDFVNMQTGRQLEAPVIYDEPGSWIDDGSGNKVYGKAIDTYNPDLIVSGWHFSETYLPTKPDGSSGQNLQTDMPLYSYVAPDTVAVLVLANVNYEIPGGTYKTGGYTVSVKHVASNDLIQDPVTGSVRIGVNGVSDVLLFTLKKVNRFVLNADDWNAINGQISFNKNANVQVTNSDKKDVVYTNPFTDNPLYAYEVHDSLYHYGYMQFQATAGTHVGQFLYVDTAWANRGNEQYLAFAWSARRDSTSLNESGSFLWGDSFEPMFYASSDLDHSNHKPDYVAYVTENAQSYASWMADSINFISAYMKDSLMENQSKFRVVYDPYVDSTLINVYQTRVKHPDYTNGAQNATWPYWWVNSFDRIPNSNIGPDNYFTRPSDAQTNTVYGDFLFAGSGSTYPIAKGAYDYYAAYVSALASQSTGHRYSDEVVSSNYEGHGKPHGIYNFHSFQEYYVKSMYGNMDKVMISTADTVPIYKEYYEDQVPSALSHTYSWSLTGKGGTPVKVEPKYKDSLFYVDIQDLGGSTIITLDQSYKNGGLNLDTHIKLAYGDKCVESESNAKATIKNGLYLIRNSLGQYLSVPIWSITDSVYWVTPESDEDLRKIPSYQWAIINTRNVDHSPFRMVNREFERVNFPYVYVYENSSAPFQIAGQYGNAAFNNKDVHAGVSKDSINLAGHNSNINPNKFVDELEKLYSIGEISFIRLGKDIKENQFLGYKYIDKDAAFMDIYAFKYLHHSTKGGGTPRYLSWNGYEEGSTDTTVYALGQDYFDKLYFNLQEMESDEIRPLDDKGNGKVSLTADNTKAGKPNADLADVYKELSSKEHLYTNADSIVLERFGFYEKNTGIPHLKPLVRQAYRLFLQDHYKWRPTEKGHYLTVGEQERYVLADKAQIINAANNYLPGSGSAFGVFGVPHFYFRNTFFDVDRKGDDYFAFVQRLDTVRAGVSWIGGGNAGSYRDIEEYLKYKHGSIAAGRVLNLIKESNELGVAILTVEDITARAVFSLRGDRAVTLSTFQLEKDNDPVYRRFHVNEPNEKFGDELYGTDIPDTLEFHILNKEKVGWRLYENSGNYTDPIELQGNRYGAYGGRVYNRSNDGEGDYYRDTLANVISFLGMHNSAETPKPNYSIFVDTAYINRGTGWIKPQYLLVVDPYNPYEKGDCDPNTGGNLDGPNGNYVIGRYLYNTAMYAKAVSASARNKLGNNDLSNVLSEVTTAAGDKVEGYFYKSDNFSKVEPIENTVKRNPNGAAYTYDGNWERLAFTWAIHKGDSLYVLKGVEPAYKGQHIDDPKALWQQLTKEYGSSGYIDFNKLITQNTADIYKEAFYPLGDRSPLPEMRTYRTFRSYEAVKAAGKTIGLQAIINLADNTHKDWVFSFRYIERGASDFIIESETSERNTNVSSVILPVLGGWVKSQNGVPVITRSDIKNTMGQASGAIFNVKRVTNPVGNEEVNTVASEVKVVAGTGAVSILNATGKNVVISNILGQTIANTTVSSDNASIAVPAGVAVVIVEGESAVKVLVK